MITLDNNLKKIFIFAIISYVIVYGYELSHFTLSIDEEFITNNYQALSLGRWGHELLHKYVFHEPYVPFASLFFALTLMAFSSVLVADYIGLSVTESIVFVVLVASMPQFAYQAEFSQQIDTVSIAVLAATASVIFLDKNSKIVFILLSIVAVSIYQSIITVPITLFLSRTLYSILVRKEQIRFKDWMVKAVMLFVLLLIALAINNFLLILVLKIYNVSKTNYINDIIMWGKQGTAQSLIHIFTNPIGSYFRKPVYGLLLFPLCIIPCIIILYNAIKEKTFLSTAVLVFALFGSIFMLNVVSGGGLPTRTYVSLPYVFALLVAISLSLISAQNVTKLIVCSLFLFSATYQSSLLFYSDEMAGQADNTFANRLLDAIYNKYPSFDPHTVPVFFYGSYKPINNWVVGHETGFGNSFFSWDNGNDARMVNYFNVTNKAALINASVDQKYSVLNYAQSLSPWPAKDAISLENGILIIKLSNNFNLNNINKLDVR